MTLSILFGSTTQGRLDSTSDRDILVLSDDCSEMNYLYENYTKRGFSVTAFSSKKASHLIKNGSLFFKHIIEEGKLTQGDSKEWDNLSGLWRHSNDYLKEIEENKKVINALGYCPNTQLGLLAAVDLLVTSIRNALIRIFAIDGCYIFSWGSLLQECLSRGLIATNEAMAIKEARLIKNQYRAGIRPAVSIELLSVLVNIAGRTGLGRNTLRLTDQNISRKLCDKYIDGYSYRSLRMIELLCAGYQDFGPIDFRLLISNPSYFSAIGRCKTQRKCRTPSS